MRIAAAAVTRFLRVACGMGALSLTLAACAPQPGAPGVVAQTPSAASAPASRRVDVSRPVQVALLAPSGSAESDLQALARDIEAAARLAAGDAPGAIELRVYDTAADPQRAVAAARAALADGAALIVGPVFSATTIAVRPLAEAAGVPVLSLSSDSAAGGAPVYVLGDLPENEADRIIGYAAAQGMGTLALVHPRTAYGDLARRAASTAALRHGVRLVNTLSYPRSFEGVQTATGAGAGDITGSGAQAVVLADGGAALRSVGAFLDYYDVSPRTIQYLGLGLWNNPETLQENALRGGWFAAADPLSVEVFATRFESATGRAPNPLAAFGYDAILAASEMIRQARAAGSDAPFTAAAITQPTGFSGARGAFRLMPNGTNQRALAVLEVGEDAFVVRDPAPTGFGPGV